MKTTGRLNKFGTLENHRYLELIIEQFKETPIDECIEWPFSQNGGGYGQVWLVDERRLELVHREAHFLYYGEYPKPFGLHTCDNPPCYNPSHIYAGTPADNMRDRWQKPIRQTKEIVGQRWDALADLISRNPSDIEIARQFDLAEENIRTLRKLLCPPHPAQPRQKRAKPELTSEQIATILGLDQRGFLKREIAFWFGIPMSKVDELTGRHRLPHPEEG